MKSIHFVPFLFAALLLAQHASAQYQSQPTEESKKLPPGSAAERKARMSGRANAVAYTKKSDLSDLPHYVPEEKPTGKLRVYGNNYLGDAPLGRWWKEAFEKAQPGIQVEYYLPSAAIAIPGLYFGLADIAINHEPSFYDSLGHLRLKGYEPAGFSAFTGSYHHPGRPKHFPITAHKDKPLAQNTPPPRDGTLGPAPERRWGGSTRPAPLHRP